MKIWKWGSVNHQSSQFYSSKVHKKCLYGQLHSFELLFIYLFIYYLLLLNESIEWTYSRFLTTTIEHFEASMACNHLHKTFTFIYFPFMDRYFLLLVFYPFIEYTIQRGVLLTILSPNGKMRCPNGRWIYLIRCFFCCFEEILFFISF